jgi:hypothetical protein
METECPLLNALLLEHVEWSLKDSESRLNDHQQPNYKYLKKHLTRWKWTPPPSEKRKEKNHGRRPRFYDYQIDDLADTVVKKMNQTLEKLSPGDTVWGGSGSGLVYKPVKLLMYRPPSGVRKMKVQLRGYERSSEHHSYWYRKYCGLNRDVPFLPLRLGSFHGFPDPLEGQQLQAVYQFLLFPSETIANHIHRLHKQLVMNAVKHGMKASPLFDPNVLTYVLVPYLDECKEHYVPFLES